jgi:dissimilatory sulfite reductase (desulfoviridin) alpha/beta subunit
MSKTSWAPGSWKYSETHNDIVSMANCKIICDVVSDYGSCNVQMVVKQNAHLIAAAPDLYDALENLLRVSKGKQGTKPEAQKLAREALAKARGDV